jgi:hypothetical protein
LGLLARGERFKKGAHVRILIRDQLSVAAALVPLRAQDKEQLGVFDRRIDRPPAAAPPPPPLPSVVARAAAEETAAITTPVAFGPPLWMIGPVTARPM